jgi:hypothetical protein
VGRCENDTINIQALFKFILDMVDWNGSPKQDGNLSLIMGDLRSKISEMEQRRHATVLSA